jgi:hypothetical protein
LAVMTLFPAGGWAVEALTGRPGTGLVAGATLVWMPSVNQPSVDSCVNES